MPFFRLLGNPIIDSWAIQKGEEETATIIRVG
jgi:hypothetical protein